MDKKVTVWDIVLIAALVAVCFAVWIFPRPTGKTVTVSVDGQILHTLELGEDRELALEDGTTVVVNQGRVCVVHSTCPDGLCEATGWISKAGEVILCVPNRISLQISEEGVDALVG